MLQNGSKVVDSLLAISKRAGTVFPKTLRLFSARVILYSITSMYVLVRLEKNSWRANSWSHKPHSWQDGCPTTASSSYSQVSCTRLAPRIKHSDLATHLRIVKRFFCLGRRAWRYPMQRQFLAHFDIFEAPRAAPLKGLDPKNLFLIIVSLNLYIILPYKMAELYS